MFGTVGLENELEELGSAATVVESRTDHHNQGFLLLLLFLLGWNCRLTRREDDKTITTV